MIDYIAQMLGCEMEKVDFDIPKSFPMFLKNEYDYKKCIICGQEVLFVKPAEFDLISCKKHINIIENKTACKVVLLLNGITQYQRKSLIDNHIAFVVTGSQIYIPFLAVCLTESYENKKAVEKFSPITQLVFLYMFYNEVHLSATAMSSKLNCTAMSVVRAYKELEACGLYHYEHCGRNKIIVPNKHGGELLNAAEPYMINPVKKVHYLNKIDNYEGLYLSGLSALGQKTMLSVSDSRKCYAAFKYQTTILLSAITKVEYCSMGGIKVEQWAYNPSVLAGNNIVDDISLILTLQSEKDERIVSELERLRRKYKW